MCGITGIFSTDPRDITPEILRGMTTSIRHRGPDDEGYIFINTITSRCEPRVGDDTIIELKGKMKHLSDPLESGYDLAFGHRRLSILDLSTTGHQPMSNETGDLWIIHNGEIYNHEELRIELLDKGHVFKSRTDTEVILHSYEQWGEKSLNKFNGMWAFVIWDSRSKKLFCSRDRFGIKPFYYYFDGLKFIFSSEIKAILTTDAMERKPNRQSIFDYISYALKDHTGDTFFEDIHQLLPGHFLELDINKRAIAARSYYQIPLIYQSRHLSDPDYSLQFRQLLEDSIRLRLASDVAVGTCLSGGLDSSSIVCLVDKLRLDSGLKQQNSHQTFSARFSEQGFDEGKYIQDVVNQTRVDAHYAYPTGASTWEILPKLIWHQEGPSSALYLSGQWETYKLARQSGIKVILDGQGGDELLAGYDIYYAALFSHLMRTFQCSKLAREYLIRYRLYGKSATSDIFKAAYHLLPRVGKQFSRRLMRVDGNPCLSKDFQAGLRDNFFQKQGEEISRTNTFDDYLYDKFTYSILPGLLHDQDKNSMAHSIESRLPFLDYRLVEMVSSMPWQQKIYRGQRKYVLRNSMRGILPESVEKRLDKMGFTNPVEVWLKKSFADEVNDIIHSTRFAQRGYFNSNQVKQDFKAYQNGRKNISRKIWRWVNLELWSRIFIDKEYSV
jgi:asparagine synthase (glutamine-hydrolysing)